MSAMIFSDISDKSAQKPGHLPRAGNMLLIVTLVFGLQLFMGFGSADTASAGDTRMGATYEPQLDSPPVSSSSSLDMRDDEYSTEFLFGLTKGVANSTLITGIKPLFFLVTIPLDLILLPFAAIGGFF